MHARPETRPQGGTMNSHDGRRWLAPTLVLALLAGALASPAPAAAATKACAKTCTASLRSCLSGARQERTTLRAACTAGAGSRRACRTKVGVSHRAVVRACRALRQRCRSCCRSNGTNCDQPRVVRDDSHQATGLVTTAGGTLTATAADGTSYALEVPAGALPDDETITLTPLAAVGGIPVGKRILAGVHAEPSGLQFVMPATLTITLPRAPAERLVGFVYDGEGTDFGGTLAITDGPSARLRVTHF